MEILFVSYKFPPSTGGMEKQCYELVKGIEKKCTTHRLIYDNKKNRLLFFLSLGRKIKKICKDNPQINIIYFNDALIATFCSFLRLPKYLSCVVTLHGLDVVFPSHIYHKYIFKRLNSFDCIIAVSNATTQKAIALGIDTRKIKIIPNGVDTLSIPIQDKTEDRFLDWAARKQLDLSDKKLLMMMGRSVQRKGFSWFAESVFPQLHDQFYLIIVGPFHHKTTLMEKLIYLLPPSLRNKIMLFFGYLSDEKALRKIINKTHHIKHLGRLPYTEIQMLFNKIDAFLMPNIPIEGDMEGFGLVCLEASVQGTLVFASNIDGIPDAIIDKKNGFLLPSKDCKIWSDKLNDFARNVDSYKQYKTEFSRFTKSNYTWEQMVNAYYNIFENLSMNKR